MTEPIAPWPGEFVSLGPDKGHIYLCSAAPPGQPGTAELSTAEFSTAEFSTAEFSTAEFSTAEPALCVHGFAGSSANWTDLMARLRDISPPLAAEALDLPGFGQSPPPPDGRYSISDQAATVARLIERRGRGPVHLIGNSLGGAVATRVAATRPDLVRSLILISPAFPDLKPRPDMARFPVLCVPGLGGFLIRLAATQPARRRVELTLSAVYYDRSSVPPQRLAQQITELERRDKLPYVKTVLLSSARAIVAEYLHRGPHSLWDDAAHITAPALVIYGSHDRLVDPRMAGRAARAFRTGRIIVLPRTGHVAQLERPQAVAAEIGRLLFAMQARKQKENTSAERDVVHLHS
jgi:pimeloyl-ACP methyl ester carboxylesterase